MQALTRDDLHPRLRLLFHKKEYRRQLAKTLPVDELDPTGEWPAPQADELQHAGKHGKGKGGCPKKNGAGLLIRYAAIEQSHAPRKTLVQVHALSIPRNDVIAFSHRTCISLQIVRRRKVLRGMACRSASTFVHLLERWHMRNHLQ